MKFSTYLLLSEGYEERVKDTAQKVLDVVGSTATASDIKKAIHKVASPDADTTLFNTWVERGYQKGPMRQNGIPDYNGSAAARKAFVDDVLTLVKQRVTAPRKHEPKPAKLSDDTLRSIWISIQAAVGASLPEGDPFSELMRVPYLQKMSIDDFDAAAKKHGYSSMNDYIATVWDDFAADALADAKRGAFGEDYDGEWFTHPNPWK